MLRKLPSKHSALVALLCIVTMTLPQLLQAQAGWIDLGNVTLNPGAVSSVATGLYGNVFAATNFADANGYYYIARYNAAGGGQWTELGNLKANNPANVVITDNAGNIYTAGQFTDSSGYYYVAKWDIWHWVELGGVSGASGASALKANGQINALATDAAGNLYAAGQFTDANGYYYVAKWNGSSWSELGTASNALKANGYIYAITADALGNIYTGGVFTDSISPYAGNYYVAQFNGTGWGKAGTQQFIGGGIYALAADNTGNVYASGDLNDTTGYGYVAQWNATGGGAWNELGGVSGVYSLLATSNLNALAVDSAGNVYTAGELGLLSYNSGVAKWNGTQWLALDSGSSAMDFSGGVNSLCIGATGTIYAGGDLINAQSMTFIAQWNGTVWDALGNNTNPGNYDGTVYNIITDIHGNLYGVGGFSEFGNQYAVKWDGVAWSYLTAGTSAFSGWGMNALATDATANVYAAGYITDGYGYNCVAKWDGTNWTELGTGSHALNPNSTINCIASDAEGKIYAGGSFTDSTGHYYVAKWDGTNWTELGGAPGYFTSPVTSVACNNTGTVYATGSFTDGSGYYYVAYWNGTAWAELGGVSGGNALNANNTINALTIDAAGNVYAAGNFTDGSGYKYVAKWNGTSWAALSASANPLRASAAISTLTADIAGNIYAAGLIADTAIAYVVKWDGTNWLKLGTGFTTGQVNTTTTDIYGNIYAAGTFTDNTGHVYVAEYLASNTGALGLVPPDLINRVANSAYIFEGQVIQSKPYWTAGHGSINTVHLIQTSKMFKGQLTCGTVELVTMGGTIGDTNIWYSHNQTFVPGQTGIFMCSPTQLDTPATGTVSPGNTGAMQLQDGMNSFIAYYNDGVNAPAADMWRTYDSLPLLYAAVQQFVCYSYTACEPEEHIIMQKFMPNQYTQKMKKKTMQNRNNQNKQNVIHLDMSTLKSMIANPSDTGKHTYKGRVRGAGSNIYYTLFNASLNGNYLTFSIGIGGDPGSSEDLDKAYIDIKYDTAVFGSYVYTNAVAGVSLTPRLDPNYTIAVQDDDYNELGIAVEYNTYYAGSYEWLPDATDPGYAPYEFVGVGMTIKQCLSNTIECYNYNSNMSSQASYIDDYTGAGPYNFDNINLSTTVKPTVPYCDATIISVTPRWVSAGIGDTVTLKGYGFGPSQGAAGGVFLVCADEPNRYMKLDASDMLLWHDNEINFLVPSYTDSAAQAFNYVGTAGSGPVTMNTNYGGGDSYITPLNVYFSVLNTGYTKPARKYIRNLTDEWPPTSLPDHHGYYLRVDTSIYNHADRYGCFKKAVHDWQCLTHVHFEIGDTIHAGPKSYYSDCAIKVGTVAGTNTLASTEQSTNTCSGPPATEYVQNFTLTINRAMINSIYFDTVPSHSIPANMNDGYSMFLHELGHAHSLGHIMDNTKLMYYQETIIKNTPTPASSRIISLPNDAPAYDGGIFVIDTSQNDSIYYSTCGIPTMHLITTCTSTHSSGTENIPIGLLNISVYPNPVNGMLTIKYEAINEDNAVVNIYNAIGQVIYKGTLTNNIPLNINTSSWSSGLYMATLQTNSTIQPYKIIKQ